MTGRGRDGQGRLQRALVTLAAWQLGFFLAVAGAVMLYLSAEWEGGRGPSALDTLLREGGALAFVTGALSVFWDLRGRRLLAAEVLATAGLSKAIQDAGLIGVSSHYRDVDWDRFFNQASRVDLFFSYASTWRANHLDALRAFVESDGTQLRVILPKRENPELVAELSKRFRVPPEDIVRKIEDAEQTFKYLRERSASTPGVELKVSDASPVYTYYRFDGRCIGVMYSQAGERVPVPALECERGGTLHKFFSHQFEILWDESSVRDLS
jgi:hypothetical protein